MQKILKFHCNNCGGENLIFDATAKWDGAKFDLVQITPTPAFCEDCEGGVHTFQSEEVVFGDEKPASNYNPMNRRGNL